MDGVSNCLPPRCYIVAYLFSWNFDKGETLSHRSKFNILNLIYLEFKVRSGCLSTINNNINKGVK